MILKSGGGIDLLNILKKVLSWNVCFGSFILLEILMQNKTIFGSCSHILTKANTELLIEIKLK